MPATGRFVKYDLIQHEDLWTAERESGLPLIRAFLGLILSPKTDSRGRFRVGPMTKIEILPFDPVDPVELFKTMESYGFINLYTVAGKTYGFIPSWRRHQKGGDGSVELYPPPPRIKLPSGEEIDAEEPDGDDEAEGAAQAAPPSPPTLAPKDTIKDVIADVVAAQQEQALLPETLNPGDQPGGAKKPRKAKPKEVHEAIMLKYVDEWNALSARTKGIIPSIQRLTEKRKMHLIARLKSNERFAENWPLCLKEFEENTYYQGANPIKWVVSFEYILKPNKAIKTAELHISKLARKKQQEAQGDSWKSGSSRVTIQSKSFEEQLDSLFEGPPAPPSPESSPGPTKNNPDEEEGLCIYD
jgi:hypothetical protein